MITKFKTTAEIVVPQDALEQVIGQDEAVRLARLAARQRRNLLLVAPPGTGKCVSRDTPIFLADGNRLTAEELFNELKKSAVVEEKNGEIVLSGFERAYALALNNGLKIEKKRILGACLLKNKAIFEIRTKSGREIKTSADHPFLSVENGFLEWVSAGNLREGVRIAVPRRLEFEGFELRKILLSPRQNFLVESAGDSYRVLLTRDKDTAKKWIFFPKFFSKEFADWLGLFLSEGYSHHERGIISFTNEDSELVSRFKSLSKKLFGLDCKFGGVKGNATAWALYSKTLSFVLNQFLGLPRGRKSASVFVPRQLCNSPNGVTVAFLSSYFEGDGGVDKEGIEMSSASKRLVQDCQFLLLRFGIISRIREKQVKVGDSRRTYYRLIVTGRENLMAFYQQVGFVSQLKNNKLLNLINSIASTSTNVDVVPGMGFLIPGLAKELDLTYKELGTHCEFLRRYRRGYRNLSRKNAQKLFENAYSQTNAMSISQRGSNQLLCFQSLANSDVYWDEIIGLKELDAEDSVIDFMVEDEHNFIAGHGGGFIIHNSMIAQAMASLLPKPTEEIAVLHNPENPERPFCEVRSLAQLSAEKNAAQKLKSKLVEPNAVPSFVAERLGFRCRHCGALGKASERSCANCGSDKYAPLGSEVLGASAFLGANALPEQQLQRRVHTTRLRENGDEEVIVYERDDAAQKIRVLDQKTLEKLEELSRNKMRRVIVPFNRKTFVASSGASETELLGDVRHDPFGGHVAASGTLPYQRVVAGAVHEAHQGVLFIDEVGALAGVQRFLLTAMQEKRFPIAGRNPQSAGASVRVDGVPCDFVLVAATNINDLPAILPALRSRITGNGYEILLNVTMPDNNANREKIARFAAQEIRKDGRIPHASRAAVDALIAESKRKAKQLDNQDGAFTLRFRELSGVIRLAGDIAKDSGAGGALLIEAEHVEQAVRRGKSIEEQLRDKYGSVYGGAASEFRGASAPRGEQKEIS